MDKVTFIPARQNDWDWAQVEYETTDRPVADIGKIIGVSATQVISMASRNGWTRNKANLVAKMTAEMVIANRESLSEIRKQRMAVIERVNAEMQAEVLVGHRKDIQQARNLCNRMFGELANYGGPSADDEETPISLLDRKSRILSRLADSMKSLISLERQAYGIQGVFEDVEEANQQSSAPTAAQTDAVLSKFAAVLAKKMGAVEVVSSDS